MKSPGVAELKARLSHYLARVKRGEEVIVTERGVPVARLVPLPRAQGSASRRERLIREGALVPGRSRPRRPPLRPPQGPADLGSGVLEALLADRAQGR